MRTDESNFNARSGSQPAAKFRVQDAYFVLFRHKWKILIVGFLGVLAAGGYLAVSKPKYTSQAKVLIKYVRETRDTTGTDYGAAIRTPDSRGDNIINSELEILTSLDLAREVVGVVGATNIVDPASGVADPYSAAVSAVRGGVEVSVAKRSSVVTITFTHPRREVASLILSNLVASYIKVHTRVHTASDILQDATRQVTLRRESLATIESELRRLKNELGIVSLDDSKRALLEQMNRVTGEILATEAQIAEHRTALGVSTNAVAAANTVTNEAPASLPAPIPSARINEYRAILTQLDVLNRRESELSLQFKPESTFVRAVRDLITENNAKREKMEAEFPGINLAANPAAALASRQSGPVPTTVADPAAAITLVRSLEAKLATLRAQMAQLQTNAMRLSANEAEITDLQRRREIEDKQYTYHYNALEQARVDNSLNEGKLSGLSVVENATPPGSDIGRIIKIAAGLAAGGFLVGVGLAFLLELFVDQSVRRPVQVERTLNVPLFVSVPRLHQETLRLVPTNADARLQLTQGGENGNGASADGMERQEGNPEEIQTYTEALRDRLMMYFQMHGLNHKPKLVGVTSCGKGAGVTTIASHLASSLSETGDGNVLYVDVNPNRNAKALPFHRGKALPGIDLAFSKETRDDARVQENLYMASLASPASGKIGVIPRRLAGLVPKMKASDYDYIIFDLPPVMQTSATSKVAGLLDMTFVVVESEKTQVDLAKKTIELLGESRANVAVVLNKHHRYLPSSLDTDL